MLGPHGGRGVKKGQKMVHMVCVWPLSILDSILFYSILFFIFEIFQIIFRACESETQRRNRLDGDIEREKKRKALETSEEMQQRLGVKNKKQKTKRYDLFITFTFS